MNKYLKQLKNGIIDANPTFMQFLGMCPTLAVTTSVSNALGMGLAATAVLICSNVFISLLRKFIPKEIRIASYIVIVSGFVTAIELLMKAYVQALYASLGLYIPLIVVNCIILARAEAFASKNPPLPSAVDGLSMGLGFTCSLTIIASVREILGSGTWLGFKILGSHYNPAIIFILPAGAFLTLGMLAALVNKVKIYAAAHPKEKIDKIPQEILENTASVPGTESMNRPSGEVPEAVIAAVVAEAEEKEKEKNTSPANSSVSGDSSEKAAELTASDEMSDKKTGEKESGEEKK